MDRHAEIIEHSQVLVMETFDRVSQNARDMAKTHRLLRLALQRTSPRGADGIPAQPEYHGPFAWFKG